jgi:CubicO group peptidase (beta-lactamase class C family)
LGAARSVCSPAKGGPSVFSAWYLQNPRIDSGYAEPQITRLQPPRRRPNEDNRMAPFWQRPLPVPKEIRVDEEGSAQIDDYLADQIEESGPGLALAIVESGHVVHAAGYGLADLRNGRPVAPDTIFHLASCGKQFTGLGILMLAEAGKLHLDDPIGQHLAPLVQYGPQVTIRRLLHHTAGIRDFYDDASYDEVVARFERPTNADVIRLCSDIGCPMAEKGIGPGEKFVYSNSGYDLLGALIEQVSGESYHDFFQRHVFDPLGMKDTFSVPDRRAGDGRCAIGYGLDEKDGFVEEAGNEFDGLVGSGSFYTTVGDLCIYDQALMANRLVSAAGMRQIFTSGRTNDGSRTDYGFGWRFGDYQGMPFAEHDGAWIGFRSYMCRYLERPLSIFALSNHPEIDFAELANTVTDTYG